MLCTALSCHLVWLKDEQLVSHWDQGGSCYCSDVIVWILQAAEHSWHYQGQQHGRQILHKNMILPHNNIKTMMMMMMMMDMTLPHNNIHQYNDDDNDDNDINSSATVTTATKRSSKDNTKAKTIIIAKQKTVMMIHKKPLIWNICHICFPLFHL